MTCRELAKKSELTMGRWYWHRRLPGVEPFPARVIGIGKLEYAWLCDPTAPHSGLKRIEECQGEFLPMEEPPT